MDLQAANAHVSQDTIARALHRVGIYSRSPRKTPLLKTRHVIARLKFAVNISRNQLTSGIRYCGLTSQTWSSLVETAHGMFGERKALHMIQNTQYQPLSMVEAV